MADQETAQGIKEIDQENIDQENGDAQRKRSTVGFPYLDLDAAVEITKGVHQVGGSSCGWDQLAAHLNQAAIGGGFRLRVMTARTFGLVTYGQGNVNLTDLGKRLCDPQQEEAARVEAFLAVPLYSAIHEKFKNVTLPPTDALEAEIASMGVASKQKGKARQAFQRSATQAGFFWSGPNRLVRPAIKAGTVSTPPDKTEKAKKTKENESDEEKHPLIEGLIKELPPPQSEWAIEARKKWLQAASTIFDVIYSDSEDSRGSLRIEVHKDSAK